MIDMFALLVSTGMMGLVVFFAVRFNRQREWFEKPQPSRPAPPARPGLPTTPRPTATARGAARLPGRGAKPWRRDA